MKTPSLLIACVLALAGPLFAQFYTPNVDFHDMAQRRYPAEAARVLAWIHNSGSSGIAEVKYSAETSAQGETVWKIEWISPGKDPRRATVRYPEASLREGAGWYRNVWEQLCGADWAMAKTETGDLAQSFWQGIASGGLTRFEGLESALQQLRETPVLRGLAASRLSGTLVQTALSSRGTVVTLDGALLARAAAWLCAAEMGTGSTAEAEWATIMILAGRGSECATVWATESPRDLPAWRCWDVLIRQPTAREALSTMGRPENRLYAAPVCVSYGSLDPGYDDLFRSIASSLYPGTLSQRLLDYAPELNRVNGRKPPAESSPMGFLREWIKMLKASVPQPGEPQGLAEQARSVRDFDAASLAISTPSPELVALLNRAGSREMEGTLCPVAVVTLQDLLIYGWDFGGIQLAALHSTYSIHPTMHESARALERGFLAEVSGWTPMTMNTKVAAAPGLETSSRYEFITQSRVARVLNLIPPRDWPRVPDAYARRRWLLDPHRALQFQMDHEGKTMDEVHLLRRTMSEASQYQLGALLTNTAIWEQAFPVGIFPGVGALREELQRAVPANTVGQLALAGRQVDSQADPFAYAQALERAHWSSGLGIAPKLVFLNYVRANAIQSAFRFYDRWKSATAAKANDGQDFAVAALTLAILQGDAARAKELEPSGTMHSALTSALLRDDLAAAAKAIETQTRKYPKARATPNMLALRDDFFPLLPALKDPKHAEHARALAAFPSDDNLLLDQWVIYARARLSREDAVTFFRATEMSNERALIVAALEGEKERFQQLFDRESRNLYEPGAANYGQQGSRAVLYAWLHNLLMQVQPPAQEPDLRPAGATPLVVELRALLQEKAPRR